MEAILIKYNLCKIGGNYDKYVSNLENTYFVLLFSVFFNK